MGLRSALILSSLLVIGIKSLQAEPQTVRVRAFGEVITASARLEIRGEQALLPLEDACRWLRLEKLASSGDKITLKGPGGERQQSIHSIGGKSYLSAEELSEMAGVEIAYIASENTLYLCGRLQDAFLEDKALRISISYPGRQPRWRMGRLKEPDRIFIDLPGFRCVRTEAWDISEGPASKLRMGQFQPDTARVVLDLRQDVTARWQPSEESGLLEFRLETSGKGKPGEKSYADSTEKAPASSNTKKPKQKIASPARVTAIRIEHVDEERAQVRIEASESLRGKPFFLRNPIRLAVDIPNASLSLLESIFVPENPWLKGIRAAQFKADVARVVLDLGRMVTFSMVSSANPSGFLVELTMPRGSQGTLAGKTVVIDPGHGGKDTGTRGIRLKILEKDMNLDIALRLEALLREAGVNAPMTRREDVYIRLPERVVFAQENAADFFISIHCDNSGGGSRVSGTKVYYHGRRPENLPLAEAIQSALIDATGLKDQGSRADTTVYGIGFHVIRNTTMPGVLVEAAYLSNPDDEASLNDPEFRQKVAQGILNGLKIYVEGFPAPTPAREEAP